jgi:REP element-mobilizing transposase RayT
MFSSKPSSVPPGYGFYIAGYVVMPQHVHLLIRELEQAKLSLA